MQRNGGGGGGGGGSSRRLPPVRAFLLRTLSAAGVAQGDQPQALLSEVQEILVSEPFHLVLDDVLHAAFDELGSFAPVRRPRIAGAGATTGCAADR